MPHSCKKCGTHYVYKWCKPCQIDNLKKILTNWTGEKVINNLIEEMHLRIKDYRDIVFEWIPYNQLSNIEEINKGDFTTVYSAKWNDGPLYYSKSEYIYTRQPNKKVVLKCMHNSQNIDNEFLDEV